MVGIITTGSFAKALWPGVNGWYGRTYNEWSTEWTALFDSLQSGQRYEEDVSITSFGLASEKGEADSISYDSERQGFVTRYAHKVWALGFMISREMMEDDLYAVVGRRRATALAYSMRQTKEVNLANVYNRAETAGYLGGDSKTLLATDHPNIAGGTYANRPTTAVDISEAALEQACIDIGKWTNDRGLRIKVMPKSIITTVDNEFELYRIMKSSYRVSTADNDVNALYAMGKFPGGVKINHYLDDSDSWFVRTDCPRGMQVFHRRKAQFAVDNDFDTENAKFKASERYVGGWTDPRGLYGSMGG